MSSSISFLSVVKEIEQQYVLLPKAWRLRVEKWVERLVTSGGNASWTRHRNAWARLLLVQVLAKKLEDPFLTQPPDGSLPPFPRHLLHHLKNSMGAHEGAFWRDLYSRLDIEAADGDLPSVPTKQQLQHPPPPPPPPLPSQPQSQPLSIPSDVGSMKMLIKEQMARIALLEEQLQQEREAHQEQIAQLTTAAAKLRNNKSNIITSRRIVSRGARAGLKIYDIARPAVRISTNSFVEHEEQKHNGDYGEAEEQEDEVEEEEDDYAEARSFYRHNNSRLHNSSSSSASPRRKEWDWSKEKQSASKAPATGLSQDEVSFLEYLESFEESCHALR